MNKINILILTKLFPSEFAPNTGVFIKKFLDNISRNNDDINFTVIRPLPFGLNFKLNLFKSGKRLITFHTFEKQSGKYKVYYPRIISYGKYLIKHHHFFYYRKVKSFVEKNNLKIDIIHSHWLYPDGYVAVKLGQFLKVPVIIHLRGSDVNELLFSKELKYLNDYTIKKSNVILAVSDNLRNKLTGIYPEAADKIQVINNGINIAEYMDLDYDTSIRALGLNDNMEKRIVYAGNILIEKGIFDLIKAIKLLTKKVKKFRLYIIGNGPDNIIKMVNKTIGDEKLSGCISLMGEYPHQMIKHWLKIANVSVLPSYSEGLPNVILESLAAGTPVIATNVGGIPEILNNEIRGRLVNPGDPAALAGAIEDYLNNPGNLRVPVRENEKFDVMYQVRLVENLYRSLVN